MSARRVGLTGTVTLPRKDWDLLLTILGESTQIAAVPLIDVIDGAYTEAVRSRQLEITSREKARKRAARLTMPNRVEL